MVMTARSKQQDLRSRFIDAAWKLFASSGYDGATIEKLVARLRVSKGAFYHYFSSKEDVLNAVVEQMIAEGASEVQSLVERAESSAIEKLNAFLGASRSWRMANIDAVLAVAEVLMRDENIIIRYKLYQHVVSLMQPALSRIIAQGKQEGFFNVADVEGTSFLLLNMMNVVAEIQTRKYLDAAQTPADLEVVRQSANLHLEFVERILGAPQGSIKRLDARAFETEAKSILSRGKDAARAPNLRKLNRYDRSA